MLAMYLLKLCVHPCNPSEIPSDKFPEIWILNLR